MTKHLKLNIKNTQLAQALKIKSDLKKKPSSQAEKPSDSTSPVKKRKSRLLSSSPFEEKEEKPPVVEAPSELEPQIAEETKEEEKPTELIASETKESISTSPIEEKLSPTEKPLSQLPKENPKAETIQEKQPQQKAVQSEERKEIAQGPEAKKSGFKEFKEFRATRKKEVQKGFDSRDRQGLREQDEGWRRRRPGKKLKKQIPEESIIRPKNLKLRLPITVKDLAQEMKLKASQLIQKLFLQGISLTLNDSLDDETTVQLLGHEFDCEIEIDTSEEKRIRITDKTIQEEIAETPKEELEPRSPIITFMGHVDHGKTSLIDAIRKSDIAAGEAGAITQHIGAFKTKISSGEIAILDTPGHEAFSEMRVRGAVVTDLVILVVAGDEGIRDQTIEAIQQAKNAGVPIVVAINKADKPSFDADKIHRQLSDQGLLSEAWGGNVITVNCSATTGQGVMELLELITLQAEILELKADPKARARGTILESEMHKGLGAVATMLVQTGTLKIGDAIVFGNEWGRVKTMHDEHLCHIIEAGPSTPVKVTGLSGLAEAGWEFIVVKNEKEARSLAALRSEGGKRNALMQPKAGVEAFLQKQKETATQKVLPLILRADVQGSLEALKTSLMKIHSDKARIEIVNAEVGEISESDVELAIASKATVIGFHTRIESMADGIIKQKKVPVHLHDIIYHAIDNVKLLMKNLLDKIEEENDVGKAEVKAVFKSSQLGKIAGCQVIDGFIKRTSHIRVIREKEVIWKGKISSLKRVKEDVKEVQKGIECGIVLEGFDTFEVGDILQAYEISYREQDL